MFGEEDMSGRDFEAEFGDDEKLSEPVQELIDDVSIAGLKHYYESQKPHKYVPTEPYKGCGQCGIGPGAYFHNSEARAHADDAND